MGMLSLFDGIFWGVFFILIGVWFIVRKYVPAHIPIIRIVIAVLFIWLGLRIIIAGPQIHFWNAVYPETRVEAGADNHGEESRIIFNSDQLDFSTLAPAGGGVAREVIVVFGTGILKINPDVPMRVVLNTAFSSVQTPDGNSTHFGESEYRTPAYREGADAVTVRASVIFGTLRIRE